MAPRRFIIATATTTTIIIIFFFLARGAYAQPRKLARADLPKCAKRAERAPQTADVRSAATDASPFSTAQTKTALASATWVCPF